MSIKYIFCINTGRSGSDYLAELLSKASNAVSFHEGLPIMNGAAMRQFNRGDASELEALVPLKLQAIRQKLSDEKTIYCETNHSYIKGWGTLLPDAYIPQEEIGVIILRRNLEDTIRSFLRVHEAPGISEWSRTWYLEPDAPSNLSHPPKGANLYDLCQWYVEETDLRAAAYQKQFPKISYVECDLEQLNDYQFVSEMFSRFGLIPSSSLQDATGTVLNTRNEWPRQSLEELLAPAEFPNADELPPPERDTLVAKMVSYLNERKADEIAAIQPDRAMGGTVAVAATGIVARAEPDLERVFQTTLKFTETERILIGEFIRSLAPYDFMFVALQRHTQPGIIYTYDFNMVVGLGTMLRKLGVRGGLKMLGMIFNGIWGRDYSHRDAK